MKRMDKVLVMVAMMLGATAAIGCNRASDQGTEDVAPVESPATAPVIEETAKETTKASAKDEAPTKAASTTPGVEQNSVRFGVNARFGGPRYYAPHAPPPARYEHRGVAPSQRHFWAPGYWRWSGRQYLWIGGRWEMNRPQHVYVGPRWSRHHHHRARWEYIPGHWVRRY